MSNSSIKGMAVAAVSTISLAAISLTGIAVVQKYEDTGLVSNTTADDFVAGLAIFGTFMSIIALSIVGKVVIGLFRDNE